ncbi:hypothetical protein SAMN04487965_2077 [Microbulbifer donghaiensis]|uniref:Uncharacterized protein n=1 Tax=Microbulbifer donghaiensis TaxID=494016 RepID=A0A1M5B5C3_9GAMM|nr:DUF6445 family protein [Microbulbifer donghaiensis]SHF37679.1 hypothetical protein SAMN04487965_2077 [Microbulbifer donghaiensis]
MAGREPETTPASGMRSSPGGIPAAPAIIGREGTPILVVDGVAGFTEALQQSAARSHFQPDGATMYPGLRAKMPREPALAILQAVYRQLYGLYQIPTDLRLKPLQAYFSLVTRSPNELGALQRIPHFDTSNPYFFALLLYLNPGVHGATGFFRHRPTGYERIGDARVESYFAAADRYMAEHGAPAQEYCTQSSGHYELYHQIEYRQHRLAIYPGNLLHSILVDTDHDIDADPRVGRLTANIFFEFR